MLKQKTGFILQLIVLMALPLLIPIQLYYGMPLVVMPALTLAGILLFTLGHRLRSQ